MSNAPTGAVSKVMSALEDAYQAGFAAGGLAERQRISEMFTGGAVLGGPLQSAPAGRGKGGRKAKNTSSKSEAKTVTPKSKRKSPWAGLTPEQREERLAKLGAAQKASWGKRRAAKSGTGPTIRDNSPAGAPLPVGDASADGAGAGTGVASTEPVETTGFQNESGN